MPTSKINIQLQEKKQNEYIQKIKVEIEPLRQELLNHKIYTKINSMEGLKVFLQHHIFAVWDFMSLLKALQNELTCVQIPWTPKGNPLTRRLINEIVLAEETNQDENGNIKSYFELYIEAMKNCDADTSKIMYLIQLLREWKSVRMALSQIDIITSVKEFVGFSFDTIETKKTHKMAAVFLFGRENFIPIDFISVLKKIKTQAPQDKEAIKKLVYYFERHLKLDINNHSDMSVQMIKDLCQNDEQKWKDVIDMSKTALQKRVDLWNEILIEIEKNNKE